MKSATHPEVCVIGAGPYGLSIAAHLQFVGADFRIFGYPMHRWLHQMPKDMLLKSEGCASNLADPTARHTLAFYCSELGLAYSDYGKPVSREVFANYGLSFQQQLVSFVEKVMVATVDCSRNGFDLHLSSGEILKAGKVIVATGMEHTAYIPQQLAILPAELRSHSAEHYDLSGFKNKDVVVLGGGQSALETAAILREEGASVTLLARGLSLAWNRIPSKAHRSLYQRFRYPRTKLGDGLQLWVYDNTPGLFHYLPQQIRHSKVRAALGPAGAWWLKDRVVERLPILLGCHVFGCEVRGERVVMRVAGQDGRRQELIADHVIAATGYQFEIRNLPFLSQRLKIQLQHEQQSPVLSSNFESSIPGLYFTGLASANSFGPVMRFVAGASYTARRLSSHITRGQHLRARSLCSWKDARISEVTHWSQFAMGASPNLDTSCPALIFKASRGVVHHGAVGIARTLGRLGAPVYAIVEDAFTPLARSRYLAKAFVWDKWPSTTEALLSAMSTIGEAIGRPTILIPADDLSAIFVAENASALRRWFSFSELPSSLPRQLANKASLFSLCAKNGIPCGQIVSPCSADDFRGFIERTSFPIIVKAAQQWQP